MRTPWGASQTIEPLIEGMVFVSTASHGGLKLEVWRNARMPRYLRRPGGWYEEDCEWCLPALVFQDEILAGPDTFLARGVRQGTHVRTAKDWFPDEYERFTGEKVTAAESYRRRREQFYRDHAADWVAVCAYGDWKEGVPKGFVGVIARQGGHGGTGPEKCFLVPQDEYEARGEQGFVIDPHRHREAPLVGPATKRVA
jgi:hypothetical protein